MKELILMRHAQAQLIQYGKNDRERSITLEGMHEIDSLRMQIFGGLAQLQLVICSNARRTRQTLDSIRNMLPSNLNTIYEDQLYQAPAQVLEDRIRDIPDEYEHAMIIGHNPGLYEIIRKVSNGAAVNDLKTGTLAFLSAPIATWKAFAPAMARLQKLITP